MKNKKHIVLLMIVGIFMMSFMAKFMSGGFGDSTGAPLKKSIVTTYKGCNSTNCHAGKPLNDFKVAYVDVKTDVPLTGWEPNAIYNVTVTANAPTKLAFGFQLTTWGQTDSVTKGTFITVNERVKINKSILKDAKGLKVDSNYYATHVTASVSHGTSNNEWILQWKAPSVKDQSLRFYLAAVCANANGSSSGDNVYKINKSIDSSFVAYPNENLVSVNELTNSNEASIYPTLTKDEVTIKLPSSINPILIQVIDLSGKVILSEKARADELIKKINCSEFTTGSYIIKLESVDYHYSKKIIKL